MTAPLKRVLVAHARDAFRSQAYISENWEQLGYRYEPDFIESCRESDDFISILEQNGASVSLLPPAHCCTLDSLYVHDPVVTLPSGFGLCNMGKAMRQDEPRHLGTWLTSEGLEIKGTIASPGNLEGGDVVWFHPTLAAVGIGYRSNLDGLSQLRAMCESKDLEIMPVYLPHWNGPSDVLHLMSVISPVEEKTLLVYSRLLPVVTRNRLLDEGFTLLEVPEEEYNTMGCNVLSLGNGKCLVERKNTETAKLLTQNGLQVLTYAGDHISRPGEGGPTCLTRPLLRLA